MKRTSIDRAASALRWSCARGATCALAALLLGCAAGPSNVRVPLPPYAAPAAPTGPARGTLAVEPVRDARHDAVGRLVGERTTIGGISMGMVEVDPGPTALVGTMLQAELRGLGFTVVAAGAEAPAQLSARLTRFEIQTPATALYWDINGAIDLALEARRADGRQHAAAYQSRCTDRTYAWPGEDLIAKVLSSCLVDLGGRIRADSAMAGFLAAP